MKAEHAAYGRAQAKVAKTREAYEQALADLEAATSPIAAAIQAAWDANHAAVQDAATGFEASVVNAARVQVEAATAARARARGAAPVLSDDEVALVEAAEAEVTEAKAAHAAAQERFKAGVTPEQLDAMGA